MIASRGPPLRRVYKAKGAEATKAKRKPMLSQLILLAVVEKWVAAVLATAEKDNHYVGRQGSLVNCTCTVNTDTNVHLGGGGSGEVFKFNLKRFPLTSQLTIIFSRTSWVRPNHLLL